MVAVVVTAARRRSPVEGGRGITRGDGEAGIFPNVDFHREFITRLLLSS